MTDKANDVDVVIIGAGSAGLSAAKTAAGLGLSFVLVEASHRIGGRAYSEDFVPGMTLDLGCHWMHSATINPYVAIADRHGFTYRKDGAWRSNVFAGGAWLDEAGLDALHAGMDASHAAIEAAAHAGRDVAIADVIDLEAPSTPFLAYWNSLGTSRDLDQVSVLDITAYNDTMENWPLKQGFGNLVARHFADVPVTLNAAATRVTWGSSGVRVETAKGTIRGRAALVTVSTNVLASGAIAFDPVLPAWKLEAVNGLPLGNHNRIGVMLKSNPFPADTRANGTILLDGTDVPMSIMVRPFGYDYVVGVTGGRHGTWLEKAGVAASVDYMVERLVAAFGSKARDALTERTIVTAWESDPWVQGAYSAALPGHGHARAELARPVDDILFFAGEASSVDCFSTCHGAYLTGAAQARGIAGCLRIAA